MVPGGGLTGISGVESGNAAALVNVLPGADVHEPPAIEPPSGDAEATVPVELPATEHFGVIDPLSPAWPAVLSALEQLVQPPGGEPTPGVAAGTA